MTIAILTIIVWLVLFPVLGGYIADQCRRAPEAV